jgi:hypothetical protein
VKLEQLEKLEWLGKLEKPVLLVLRELQVPRVPLVQQAQAQLVRQRTLDLPEPLAKLEYRDLSDQLVRLAELV